MRFIHGFPVLLGAALGLAACSSDPPPPTQVYIQQAPTTVVPAAPMPPPPPISELVPPPPPGAGPTVWQPGHWQYTGLSGNPWSWQKGQYVGVPPGAAAWGPGQWQQQAGGWGWRDGHWAA